jgi:hypothetical protein
MKESRLKMRKIRRNVQEEKIKVRVEEGFKLCTLFCGKMNVERLGEAELGCALCLAAHAS